MNKLLIIFFIFFLFVINLSFVNSKFVCGFVNNSEEFSSSWASTLVYSEENPLDIAECKVNPENKFCCDLDEITSVSLKTGKKIFAEIFDETQGLVAGPVSLYLTEEGFDIFPEMILQKAIKINTPNERIFINQSLIQINLSLSEKYNNLKYYLNSSEGLLEQQICTNCIEAEFPVSLAKGKNELIIVAYGNREIAEKLIIYNLDYLNFKLDVFCNKCKIRGKYIYIPAEKEIIFSSNLNASHEISGDFLFYFPTEWMLYNFTTSEDISLTHKSISKEIINQKEFTTNYTLKSPKAFLKKVYSFYQLFEGKETETKVIVFKSNLMPFRQSKHFEGEYFIKELYKKGSPNEPILINSNEDSLKTIAIFPNKVISKSYSNLELEKNRKDKEYSFKILTSLSQSEINQIFIIFKVEKGKFIEVYNTQSKLNLELYEEDSNYNYYSLYVHEKGPFRVKIF